ncbi:MAG: class I SAM-dependent methyltransferase [Aggregatilineales bacterium]
MNRIKKPRHVESRDRSYSLFRRKIIALWVSSLSLSLISVTLLGSIGYTVPLVLISALLIYIILTLYHRTQIESFHHYRQLEALTSIHALIKVRHPLPPMRIWAISPDFALLVLSLVTINRPKHIVELGSGTSTLISSYALQKIGEGKVTSLEHLAQFAKESERGVAKHGFEGTATVVHAPLKTWEKDGQIWKWYDIKDKSALDKIDLLIVDGPPGFTCKLARYPALPELYDQLNEGAFILVDDVMRDDETEMINRWLDEFNLEIVEIIPNEKGAAILRKTAAT